MIRLVHVRNPLLPASSRSLLEIPCVEGRHLDEYLKAEFTDTEKLVASHNGKVIPPEMWPGIIPRDGDCIVVAPNLGNEGVWRTLAQVAVMAGALVAGALTAGAAIPLLGIAGGAGLLGGGALMGGLAAGIVSIAGNVLIQTLMPGGPSTKAQSPSYQFAGPQSLAQSGTVIPKGYGTFLSGGNIISSFVDVEGSDQYINALVCFGFGPARSISGVQINGKALGSYQNVEAYYRLGSNDQPPIAQFNRIVNGYPQETQVTYLGGPVVVPGTGDQTQALQVDVNFPVGVFYITGDGNTVPCQIIYKVEYSVSGEDDWQGVLQPLATHDIIVYNEDGTVNPYETPVWVVVPTSYPPGSGIVLSTDSCSSCHTIGEPWNETMSVTTVNEDGSTSTASVTFHGEWQLCDPTLNQVAVDTWTTGWVKYVNATTESVYNRTSIYGLSPAKYDVRVTKYGSNNASDGVFPGDVDDPHRGQEVWLHSVNEITYQDLAYPNMILLGVRALATNQINGANINVTALVEYGLRTLDNNVLPSALQAFEEDNPACVAADMLLDDLYGGGEWPGISPANLERYIDEWVAWAELNDTLVPDGNGNNIRLHVFNGIFDNEDNLWNQVNAVAQMSRAAVIPMGLDYGVFIDQEDTPVQMFSMGNIIQDSFQERWIALDDRANQIEVQFADSTRYYRQDNPIVYIDPADLASGVAIKNVRINGKGITIPAQAWHLGSFKGLCNKNLLRLGEFKCDVDAVACRPGNLVILQHDVPQWGWGGRLLAGNTAALVNVDRNDLPWDGSTAYNLMALFAAVQRYTGTISSVSTVTDGTGLTIGTALALSSFDNTHRVTRCVVAGTDCLILSASAGSVVVTLPPGFTPASGQTYVLYDTDVIETATVSGVTEGPNGTQIVALGTPFTQAPDDYAVYFYGEPSSQKIVRVTAVKKASEMRSTIEWIDYNPACYTVQTPIVGETSAQVTTNPGVTNLEAAETFGLQTSGNYEDYIVLTWQNGPNTAGVGIYGNFGGATQMLARLTGSPTSWKMQAVPGVTWVLTVVGFDANDYYADFATAPSVTITPEGITANLLQDSSFQSGFAYWNVTPRAGDTLAPDLSNDGEAVYTVAESTLSATQVILNQVVNPSKWSIGTLLMLSAYFETSGTPSGNLVADIAFYSDAGVTLISTARAVFTMTGAASLITRVNTAATAVPSDTAQIRVRVLVDGTVSVPVASSVTASHLLLEVAESGQTEPSVWADIDSAGQVTDVFTAGSSSSLRAQASALPVFTGSFPFSYTDSTITFDWSDLQIAWPDGGLTEIVDGSMEVTGLSTLTPYYAYLYFDIVNGGVKIVTPTTPVGTPAVLTLVHDAAADAACKMDGRVPLTPGGLAMQTAASGQTGSGGGGGSGAASINVSVTPGIVSMTYETSAQSFTATVTGSSNTAVVWSLGPGSLGTIDSSGNWTPPASPPSSGGATVIAQSVANSSCYGAAEISWHL